MNAAKVDREHLNYMQINQGDPFKLIDTEADILEAFAPNPLAYAQVSRYFETGILPSPSITSETSKPENDMET